MMLSLTKQLNEDDKTICELFYCLMDELEEITFSQFMQIFSGSFAGYGNVFFHITEAQLEEFTSCFINCLPNKVNRLNEKEQLNTCLVADISGSMYEQMDIVKNAMINFISRLQYDAGDKASLISFDNYVNLNLDFTQKKEEIVNEIQEMYVGNCTALNDALYVAVCNASRANGAKCVIAFTDGYDNVSTKTVDDVLKMANLYDVPIYLVGIGDNVDSSMLQNFSNATGGYYQNILNGSEMEEIYNFIYQKNKEMYMIEYTEESMDANALQNIYLAYDNGTDFMRCESSFQPSQLQASEEEYAEIIQRSGISNLDIEDEVLDIREIYDGIVQKRISKKYIESSPCDKVTVYSENGEVSCVIFDKGVNDSKYTRYYYYKDSKLIFAYLESEDSHRLYFNNDKLFRWHYASNAVNFSEADNHDNEDSADFRTWESFALNEAYLYN